VAVSGLHGAPPKPIKESKAQVSLAIPISATDYMEVSNIPPSNRIHIAVKSENGAAGAKLIAEYLDTRMKIIGFERNEKPLLHWTPMGFHTVAGHPHAEFKATGGETLKALVKKFHFFNSRNLGTISGEVNQVVADFTTIQQSWNKGYTVASYDVIVQPVGQFFYNNDKAKHVQLPIYSNDRLRWDIYYALPEGATDKDASLIGFHSESAMRAFLNQGVVPPTPASHYSPKDPGIKPKDLVGRWVSLGAGGKSVQMDLFLMEGPNGALMGQLGDLDTNGIREVREVTVGTTPEGYELREGRIVDSDNSIGLLWNRGMSRRIAPDSPPGFHRLVLNPVDDLLSLNRYDPQNRSNFVAGGAEFKYMRATDTSRDPQPDLSGHWVGTLESYPTVTLGMDIRREGDHFEGISTVADAAKTGTFRLQIKPTDLGVTITETAVVEKNYDYWLLKSMRMDIQAGSTGVLRGIWAGVSAVNGKPAGGGFVEWHRDAKAVADPR
jgi:hypothetical protein